MLQRIFPLLSQLAPSGTQRDSAKNRQLLFSQYAALVLLSFFNPLLNSARALVAASGIKKVRRITTGGKVSLGAFSEAVRVFDPQLLEPLVVELRQRFQQQQHQQLVSGLQVGDCLPQDLARRLVAVDATVLTAIPQLLGQMQKRQGDQHRGQWRMHTHFHVRESSVLQATLTPEPAQGHSAERAVLINSVTTEQAGSVYLLDRGYRAADVFNHLASCGCDYICRLNRGDGKPVNTAPVDAKGQVLTIPTISEEAQKLGVIADEWITMGGGSGASRITTDHAVRRIVVVPPPGTPSSARQGRVRTDQSGREELVLATTLHDLPAEQIVKLYECRWQIEIFFRFLKHVLHCDHLLSTKTQGVQIQITCAVIAALLLALATGGNINKRMYERISLYLTGWADEEELLEVLPKPPP